MDYSKEYQNPRSNFGPPELKEDPLVKENLTDHSTMPSNTMDSFEVLLSEQPKDEAWFICSEYFTESKRRYYCRVCSNMVCANHSAVQQLSHEEMIRVCDECKDVNSVSSENTPSELFEQEKMQLAYEQIADLKNVTVAEKNRRIKELQEHLVRVKVANQMKTNRLAEKLKQKERRLLQERRLFKSLCKKTERVNSESTVQMNALSTYEDKVSYFKNVLKQGPVIGEDFTPSPKAD